MKHYQAFLVSLIVLLILAGVSLSAVFSEKGIFKRAENAIDKYGQAKARETLELVLGEAQMQKYEEGLNDEQLNKKIEEVGELIAKEDPNSNNQQVIVDGYIFLIDRSVPKIVDYVGKADNIIITATLSNNDTNGWIKPSESEAKITGTIKTYSGGKITKVSAKKGNTEISGFSIDENGRYEIRVTESATYTIKAEDSKGKTNKKEIPVEVKVDNIKPTVDSITTTLEGNKIKLSATGTDKESGIDHFNYEITPTDGVTPVRGSFNKNKIAEITVSKWVLYTIKVTATDKCENTTEIPVEKEVDMRDTTGPNIVANVTASGLKIRIYATATDGESGLSSLSYSITPTTGLTNPTGPLTSGTQIEVTSISEGTYTVTITAKDVAGNTTTKTAGPVRTADGITVAEAKAKINASNIRDYIGTKITDYNPTGGGTWRVFYYDETGYFGDGAGTLYLKRECESAYVSLYSYTGYTASADGIAKMKQMNPKWRDYPTAGANKINLDNERCVSWLCDSEKVWNAKYKTTEAKYAIGSPSVEMYMRAYNIWKTGNENANNLVCIIGGTKGYSVGANGEYANGGRYTNNDAIEAGPNNIFLAVEKNLNWLASPSSSDSYNILNVNSGKASVESKDYNSNVGIQPVVSLNH